MCKHATARGVGVSTILPMHLHKYVKLYTVKTFWVTSTLFWSSQLHACCVCDTLQTSRDAFNLIESVSVVETLPLFVKLGSSCRKPSHLATFLP